MTTLRVALARWIHLFRDSPDTAARLDAARHGVMRQGL